MAAELGVLPANCIGGGTLVGGRPPTGGMPGGGIFMGGPFIGGMPGCCEKVQRQFATYVIILLKVNSNFTNLELKSLMILCKSSLKTWLQVF